MSITQRAQFVYGWRYAITRSARADIGIVEFLADVNIALLDQCY